MIASRFKLSMKGLSKLEWQKQKLDNNNKTQTINSLYVGLVVVTGKQQRQHVPVAVEVSIKFI